MRRSLLLGTVIGLAVVTALGPLGAQETADRVRVTVAAANVRSGPGTSHRVVLTLPRGERLPVLGREGRWYRVDLSGRGERSGYIHDSTVELVRGGAGLAFEATWIAGGAFALLLLAGTLAFGRRVWRKERESRWRKEAEALLDPVKAGARVPEAQVDLLLEPGELGVLQEESVLLEPRAHGGAAARMGRALSGGGSKKVDAGVLILTTQRLVFDGQLGHRTFPLRELESVEPSGHAIEAGTARDPRRQAFKVRNPYLWTALIRLLASAPGSGESAR